jgi:prepilin-type N-terminal cleavage/methylation domain-containing protein
MTKIKENRGFSLIELLMVVAIILILATISVIALKDQQSKARDAKRISDIRQLRTALEFYFSDEGQYPIETNKIVLGLAENEKLCSKESGGFVSSQTECKADSTYMSKVPSDPLADRKFYYTGTAEGYDITFITEKLSSLGPEGTYHAHSEAIDQVQINN